MALLPHDLPYGSEVQDCFDTVTGKRYVFASQLLLQACVHTRMYKVLVPITDCMYEAVAKTDLSRRKLRNLRREWGDKIHENNEKRPLLFATIRKDEFHFLVDGNHRLTYMWENDVKFAISYICERSMWEHFLVEGG